MQPKRKTTKAKRQAIPSEEQVGVAAVLFLNKRAGITLSPTKALRHWRSYSTHEQRDTLAARAFFKQLDGKVLSK